MYYAVQSRPVLAIVDIVSDNRGVAIVSAFPTTFRM